MSSDEKIVAANDLSSIKKGKIIIDEVKDRFTKVLEEATNK